MSHASAFKVYSLFIFNYDISIYEANLSYSAGYTNYLYE